MNLTRGVRPGPDEIVAPIGAGDQGGVRLASLDSFEVPRVPGTIDDTIRPDGEVYVSRTEAATPQTIVVMTNWNAR